ncbi:MAG: DUF4435 domain-containing protein [Acidobacteriota bacterium]
MSDDPLDFPTRSQPGKSALDVFYVDFNSVNFYVEDEDQENLYFEILGKLFGSAKFNRIFPLGGKPAVLEHARSDENQCIDAVRVYILDRDFDFFLGKNCEHPNVFYLDRFCIESHLLEPQAIIELVVESEPKLKRQEIEKALNLEAELTRAYRDARPLSTLFLCAQLLELGIRNTSSAPEAFCAPKRLWEIDEAAIERYEKKMREAATTVAQSTLGHCFERAGELAASADDFCLVSGKFVAAMLFHYVKNNYKLGSITFESFIYRVAKSCTLSSMQQFAQRINAAVQGHSAAASTR